jgi:DNA-binding CsgD family transcriptional regulator
MEPKGKRAPTPLFRRHVRRPRLTALLDESAAQAILIVAPAGYGKTSLVTEWVERRESVAWYRATESSDDLAAFSVGVAEALEAIAPDAATSLHQRVRVAEQPEKLARVLAELLAENLVDWPEDAWLVLDDYQLVSESPAVEEFVDWLLTLSPIRLVVTSRRRPRWASARRVLYGEITEITRAELAMTQEEARLVLGTESDASVEALVKGAEGWPAVIGLAALSATREMPSERVSDALFRYFAEEVLKREAPEIRQILMAASILPSTPVEMLRCLVPSLLSEEALQHLSDDGLIQRVPEDAVRLHPLMRDFFHGYVGAQDPAERHRLQHAVIEAALDRGRWEDALTAAFEANETQTMAEILGRAAPDLIASGRVETVEKWFERCGQVGLSTSGAVLARSEVGLWRGQFSYARLLAEQVLRELEDEHPLRSRAARLAGQAAYWLNDDDGALAHNLHAVDWATTLEEERAALWGAYLGAQSQDRPEARELLDSLSDRAGTDVDSALRVAVGRVVCGSRDGSFKGAWSVLEPLVPLASTTQDPAVSTNFLAHCAYVKVMAGEYDKGLELVTGVLGTIENLRLTFALPQSLFWKAQAEIGLRRLDDADATGQRLQSLVVDPYTEIIDLHLRLRLELASGSLIDWDQYERDFSPQIQRVSVAEFCAIAALWLAAAGNPLVERYVDLSRSLSSSADARYLAEFADLITAMRRGDPDARSRTSSLACASLENGAADAFVTAYRIWPEILVDVATSPYWPMLRPVVKRANDASFARGLGLNDFGGRSAATLSSVLTPREVEVLDLIRQGLSNSDIADTLVISTSTAKAHVHHILEKLGVESRLQAALTPNPRSDSTPD